MNVTRNANSPVRLAVLISGGGSTMLNLHKQIVGEELDAEIAMVIASRECSGVDKATSASIVAEVISPKSFQSIQDYSDALFSKFSDEKINLVVLAGFLSKIIIPDQFSNRVMNIHPSLIPAFCGKGMYGHHVHEAVVSRGCKVSGCTVHFCDNEYDHGPIILQQTVQVAADDTADVVAARVQAAECEAYPRAIQLFAEGRLNVIKGKVHIRD